MKILSLISIVLFSFCLGSKITQAEFRDVEPVWEKGPVPNGFWDIKANRLSALLYLERALGYLDAEDWYGISANSYRENSVGGLLKYYGKSPSLGPKELYPDYDFRAWKFKKTPMRFWHSLENRRSYLMWLHQKLKFKGSEDWYAITRGAFENNYGLGLVTSHYKKDITLAGRELFPTYDFKRWLFSKVPNGFWNKYENRKEYVTWLGQTLGFEQPRDWLQLRRHHFKGHGFGMLSHYYGSSVTKVLEEFQPEALKIVAEAALVRETKKENRSVARQQREEKTAALEENSRIEFLKNLENTLNYNSPEGWYDFDPSLCNAQSCKHVFKYYGNTPIRMARELYPHFDFKPWLFTIVERGFWSDGDNRLAYLRWLEEINGISGPEGWYGLKQKDFYENSGGSLLSRYYRNSPIAAAMELYPEFVFEAWLMASTPQRFWQERKNRRAYIIWLGQKLGYETIQDWYQITAKDFKENNGAGMLVGYYDDSPQKAVLDLLPEYDLKPWLFKQVINGFWEIKENRLAFLRWFAKENQISEPADWYRVSRQDIAEAGGYSLVLKGHLRLALAELHPEFEFVPWSFGRVDSKFWQTPENRLAYIHWLGDLLGFKGPEDWYQLSALHFTRNGGSRVLEYYNNTLIKVALAVHPDFPYKAENFDYKLKGQNLLLTVLKEIFPNEPYEWNFRHPDARFKVSGAKMEIDIYFPMLRLGFEYQGGQHYGPVRIFGGEENFELTTKRDSEKRETFRAKGITVVEIPAHAWRGDRKFIEDLIAELGLESLTTGTCESMFIPIASGF